MTVQDIVKQRNITECLHFTTNSGLTGILATCAIKCRNKLNNNNYLEYIYKQNCEDRSKDVAWHSYVNLSIASINHSLFGISANNWHRDLDGWWCIISLSPEILSHDGVVFTTTNNIYTGVSRGAGPAGLAALFEPKVIRWTGKYVTRTADTRDSQPTCIQAEALYPEEIPTDFIQVIYVRDATNIDAIKGTLAAMSLENIECVVSPSHFGQ